MEKREQKPEQEIQPIETDNQAEKVDRLIEFFILNKNLIIAAAIGFMVTAGGLFFYQQYNRTAEAEAHALLSHAESNVDNGNWLQAIDGDDDVKGLRKIVDKYGSTPSGNHAKILMGESFLALGEIDSALTWYSLYAGKKPNLAASAKAGEASCLLLQEKFSEAAAAFEKAAETAANVALKASYLSDAADTRLLLGDTRVAVDLYKKIVREYPGFAAASKAQQSLLSLAGKTENTDL